MKMSSKTRFKVIIALLLVLIVTFSAAFLSSSRQRKAEVFAETDSAAIARAINGAKGNWKDETIVTVGSESEENGAAVTIDEVKSSVSAITIPSGARVTVNGVEPSVRHELENTAVYSQLIFDVPVTVGAESVLTFNVDVVFRAGVRVEGTLVINGMAFNQNSLNIVNRWDKYADIPSEGVLVNGSLNNDGARGGTIAVAEGATLSVSEASTSSYIKDGQSQPFSEYDGGALFLKADANGGSGLTIDGTLTNGGSVIYDETINAAPVAEGAVVAASFIGSFNSVDEGNGSTWAQNGDRKGIFYSLSDAIYVFYDADGDGTSLSLTLAQSGQTYQSSWFSGSWNDVPVTLGNATLLSFGRTIVKSGNGASVYRTDGTVSLGGGTAGSYVFTQGANELVFDGGAKWTQSPSNDNLRFILGENADVQTGYVNASDGNYSSSALFNVTSRLDMYGGVKITRHETRAGASVGGGMKINSGASLYMYGGEISYNAVTQCANNGAGGGIYSAPDTHIEIYNAQVTRNALTTYGQGSADGAGIAMDGNKAANTSLLTLYGGEISYNCGAKGGSEKAAGGGGIIGREGTAVNMYGGYIRGNWTGGYGGAMLLYSSSNLVMTGGAISGNWAAFGGGINMTVNSSVDVSGGELSGNTAFYNSVTAQGGYGGAICVGADEYTTSLSAKFSGTAVVSGNRALYGGGLAVYTNASNSNTNKLEMSGGTITGNSAYSDNNFTARASERGDGVYFNSPNNACYYPILYFSGAASIDSSNNVSFNIPTSSTVAPIRVDSELTGTGLAALVRLTNESSWSGKSIVSYASQEDIDRNKFLLDSTQYSFYSTGSALSIHSVSGNTDYVAEVYNGEGSLQGRYISLEAAVSAAQDGQIIRVLRSATIASPISTDGKNLTVLPGNGVDITIGVASGFQLGDGVQALLTVNGGSLTVGDSTEGSKIAFDGNKSSGLEMSLVYVSSGSFTLGKNATLRNNNSAGNAGAVYLGENTFATIGGVVADTSGTYGAIYVSNNATLNVDGATFSGKCRNNKGENYAVYAIGENSKVYLNGEVNFGGSEQGEQPYSGNAVYTENRILLGEQFRNAGFPVGVTFPSVRTAGTTIVDLPQAFIDAWAGAPVDGYDSAATYARKMFAVANMDADYMLIVANADPAVANALVVSKSVVFVFDFTYTDGYEGSSAQNGSVRFPGNLEKLLSEYTPAISSAQLARIHTRGNLVVLELQSGSNFPLAAFSGYAAWEGYSLIRWEVSGTDTSYDYNGNIAYTDSEQEVSVRSVWVSNTYHITFDTNSVEGAHTSGFQGFGGTMEMQTIEYDDIDKALHANEYTLVGWKFVNWNTSADGRGISVDDGETPDLTAIATGKPTYTTSVGEDGRVRIDGAEYNIALYAQWSPVFSGKGVGTAQSPFVLKTVEDLYLLEATVNGAEKGSDPTDGIYTALKGYYNTNADGGAADYTAEDYSGYYFLLDEAFDNAASPFTGVIGRVSVKAVSGGTHANDGVENHLDQEDQISHAVYGGDSATTGGNGIAEGTPFKGTFNGNNRTVSLRIDKQAAGGTAGDETLVGVGLFGYTDHAVVKNLTLDGSVHGYAHVGGLVGYAFGGTISGIYNKADITSGGHDVGGVVGTLFELTGNYARSSVSDAVNAGAVGYLPRENADMTYKLDIDENWNELEVMPDAVGVRFGGIVGAGITLRLSGGYNLGSVTGRYGVGGVVGTLRSLSNSIADDAIVTQSFNAGKVTATAGLYASYTLNSGYKQNFITAYAGGITGRLVGVSSVSYSYNFGDVAATFVAEVADTVLSEEDYTYVGDSDLAALSEGKYLGARGVGGIVGFTSYDVTAGTQNGRMAISNVYNTGDIVSWAGVGGVAGYLAYANITNSFNGGNVTATGFHYENGVRKAGGYMLTTGQDTVYAAYLGAVVGRGVSASLDATVSYNINAAYEGLTDATIQAIGDSNYNGLFGLDQNISSAVGLKSSQMRVDSNGSAPSGFVSTFNSTGWSFYHYVGETAEGGAVTYSYYPQISAFANGEGTSEHFVGGTPIDLAAYSKDSAQIKYRASSEEGGGDTPVTDETTFRLTFVLNGGAFDFNGESGSDGAQGVYYSFADKNKRYYDAGGDNWYYIFGYPVDKVDYVSEEGEAVGSGVLEQPDVPFRVGYTFAGWYADGGFTESFNFNAIPGQNTTVYAKWEPVVYTITYENVVGVGGSWVGEYNKNFDIQTSVQVSLPTDGNLVRRGYVFSGWKYAGVDVYITQYSITAGSSPSILLKDASGVNRATVPFSALTAGTLVLTAEWTAESYSIEYRLEQGFVEDGLSATLNNPVYSYTVSSADITLPLPQKTGYTFMRWVLVSIDGNESSVEDSVNAGHYAIGGAVERIRNNTVGDFVLQAEWTRNEITVYLDARGGTIENYTALGLQYDGTTGLYYASVSYYDTLAALLFDGKEWNILEPTGNTFNGWYTNSTATADTKVTASTLVTVGSGTWTLYAGYETAKYTLTIDLKGNLPENLTATVPANAQSELRSLGFSFDNGIRLTISHGSDASSALSALAGKILIGDGQNSYYFNSWTVTPENKSIYNVTDDLKLAAHYEENRVTVNFVGRNGEFLAGISVSVNGTIAGDVQAFEEYTALLQDTRLTEVFGYTFENRWTYSGGEFSVEDTAVTGAMVVYAVFTPWKVVPTFYFAGDGSAIAPEGLTYSFGSPFGTLPSIDDLRGAYQGSGDYLGYQIEGFYLDADLTKAININTPISEDMWQQSGAQGTLSLTLYVKIGKITYHISFNGDGGTFADYGGAGTYTGKYCYGDAESVVGFSEPTRVGYELVEWYISGTSGTDTTWRIPAGESTDYAAELIELLRGKYAGALNAIAIWKAEVYDVWFYAGENGYFTVPETVTEGVTFYRDTAGPDPVTEAGAQVGYCVVEVEYGKVPSLPAFVSAIREGYTFNGWLTSDNAIVTAVRDDSTYTGESPITAQWMVSSFTIVFITNGGTPVADKAGVPYGANLKNELSGITTARTGYKFLGWYKNSEGTEECPPTMPASSLVLYAKWEIVTSTLTLNLTIEGVSGAESAVKTAVENALKTTANVVSVSSEFYRVTVSGVAYGTSLAALNSLSVNFAGQDYTLNGLWVTGGVPQPLGSMPEYNCEASASFTHKTSGVTITFLLNDGQQTVYYTMSGVTSVGAELESVLVPVREGYTFAGWYDAAEGGNRFEFGADLSESGDVMLYAHWTAKTYTITLDLRGGSGTTSVSGVAYGTALWSEDGWILPEPESRGGYVFDGWYIDSSCTESAKTTVMPDGDLTLYAGWIAVSYELIFEYYGGSDSFKAAIETVIVYPETDVIAKPYYRFVGWTIRADEGDGNNGKTFSYSQMPDLAELGGKEQDGVVMLTIVAQYEAVEYFAEYRDEDGALLETLTVSAEYAGRTENLYTPAGQKEGYTFVGWRVVYADHSPSDTVYKQYRVAADGIYLITDTQQESQRIPFGNVQNIDFYAMYRANEYTVTFDANGGNILEEDKTVVVSYGAAYGELPKTDRLGYIFLGWFTAQTGGVQVTLTTVVATAGDHTLYAQWKPVTYTVIFIGNGAYGAMNPQKITYDAHVSLTQNSFALEGYGFSGWNTHADGSGTAYADRYNTASGDLTSVDNDIVILYAQWTDISFTVKFEGGEGATGSMNDQKMILGSGAKLNFNTFVKVGYDFAGWRLADGSTFTDGAEFTVSEDQIPEDKTVILTAMWTEKTYSIVYEERGGNSVSDATDTDFTGNVTLPTATRTGYAFLGWATADDDNVVYASGAVVPVDLLFTGLEGANARTRKLYAVWKINVYTVTLNGEHVSLEGEAAIEYGNSYTLTLTAIEGYYLPETVSYTMGGEKYTVPVVGKTAIISSVEGDLVMEAFGVAIEYTVTIGAGDGGVFTLLPDGADGTEGSEGNWTKFKILLAYGTDVTAILNSLELNVSSAYHHLSDWQSTGDLKFLKGELTVTAIYEATESAIIVTVVHADGKVYTLNATYGAALSADEAAFTYRANGYAYSGWYYYDGESAEDFVPGETPVVKPVTVYPKTTANAFDVTTNSANVDFVGGGDSVAAFGQSYTITYLPALGYELSELAVKMNGQPLEADEYSYDAATGRLIVMRVTGNIEISATVTAKEYAAVFDPNGGTLTGEATQAVAFGERISEPAEVPKKEGFTFVGWTYNGAAWDFENDVMPAGNVTLVASWQINIYTVTFETDGVVSKTEYIHGAKVTRPVDPVKRGYTFLGWYKAESETEYAFTAIVTGDLALTAKWRADEYSITYILNGGTNGKNPDKYTVNDTVSFADAVRTGYTFTGWYDMESGGNKVTQIETNSTGNVTLYARWKANSYTVVFDPNGGENTMSELSLTYDVAAQLDGNAFARNGYTFAGWATEEGGAVRYLDGATVINLATESGEEVTLYAVWTANSYTVTFDGNEGTVQGIGSKQVTFDAAYGTLPKAERKGYAFLGWFTAQTDGERVTDLTFVKTSENHTLYAHWEAIEFEIVYHGTDGESATETQSFTYADEDFVSAQLQSFTRTGYTFAGWATEEDGYIVYSDKTPLSALSLPTENAQIHLYAIWTVNSYTVTFDSDGGTAVTGQTVAFGGKISEPLTAPTKEGYTFAGWYYNETAWNFETDTMPAEAVRLVAKWTVNSYKVTFDANGGTFEGETVQTVAFGEKISEPAAAPTRKGYTFGGWMYNGEAWDFGIGVMPAGNVTLIAQWTANEYKIIFRANDGSENTAEQTLVYDKHTALDGNAFTRNGYTFAGWATEENGAVRYLDGATVINFATESGEEVTLYAIWTANSYTVTVELTMPDSTDEATVSAVRGYIASALSKWRVSVAAQKTSLTVTISNLTYGTSLSDLSGLFLTEESYSQIIVDGALYLFVWTEPPVGTLGANDMEFAGGWTNDNVKTVTVSVDGESAFETTYYVTEKDGSYTFDLGALNKPEKRGFVFTGWKSSDGDVEENVLTITGSEAHVAPEWKQITYTATYGGEAVALDGLVFTWDGTQFALKAGGVAELADGLSRTGYTFGGWQYEGRTIHTLEELFAGSALGNAGGKEETVAIGLTAVWTENVYTVKYEANGALGSMNDRQFVYGQEAALDSNAFVFAGYDFGGWTWQGKTYADNTAFIVTEDILPEEGADIILTATWIIKTYKVAYDGREGQPERQADTADYTQTLTLPTATREGYIFLGWATEEGGNVVYADGAKVSVSMLFTGLEGVDERAATLYAVWKIHAYTVTLRGENVTLQGASVVEHGSSYTLTLTAVKGYGIPEKVSYSVGGGEKRTAAVSGNTVTIFFVTGDLFIEATGVADIYLVTVDAGEGGVFTALPEGANGTAGSEGSWTQFTVSLAYGADVYALILNQIEMKVAGAPYQTLYDWNVTVGEREWLFSLEDDITIEARYAQEKVSISIVLPDGTIRSEEVTYNRELDLVALNIAVEGYTISGWRKGDELLEGGKTLVTEPVAIYAVASANTYEVTLIVSEDEKKTITVTFGEAFAYADGWVEIPVRLGHTFVGWKKDGVTVSGNQIVGVLEEGYTLIAEWSVNKYTVTFHANGGHLNGDETIAVGYGETFAPPIAPEREGYTFEGWEYNFVEWNFEKDAMPAENITLVAKWSMKKYTVTFVNGTEQSEAQYSHGATVTQPNAPTKNGYTFLGWYAAESETAYDFTTLVTSDLTLSAKWSAVQYTITYILNGGANGENPAAYTVETDTFEFKAATRTGYVFVGWYDKESGGAEVTEIEKGSTGNVTLYAIWRANEYVVKFESNGGTQIAEQTIAHGGKATQPNAPTKNGYTFLGWYAAESETAYDFTTLVTSDLTLSAKWSAVQYTITYILNGGANGENPAAYTVETDTFEFKAATRTGYVFVGWYDKESGGAEVTEIEKGSTGSVTLYAIWRANEYVVKFETNGGTPIAEQTIAHGGTVEYTVAERENHLFVGWFTDESLTQSYSFNSAVKESFTLYAKWRLQKIVGTAEDGVTVTISSDSGFDDGTKLVFVRVTEEELLGTAKDGLADHMTLARLYDISLVDANGVSVPLSQPVSVGISVEGLTDPEGRYGIAYIPETGEAEELAAHIGADGRLYFFVEHFSHYAIVDIVSARGFAWWWILVAVGGCAVLVLVGILIARSRRIYELNYVNGGIASQRLKESSLIDLPLPEREDEVFVGWYYDEEFRDRALLTTMPKQNLILFAKWRRMTEEEREMRDRNRAEAAAAAAEGFHEAETENEKS